MKTYTRTVISESEYKHIQHLHTNIYRVMVRESEQDGMLTVATAKYDHEPTEDEIMADYNASVEAVNRMALQQAQRQKIREIDAYNTSDNVDAFLLNGEKHWLTLDERKAAELSTKARQRLGYATTEQYFGGKFYTIPCDTLLTLLAHLEDYALSCYNNAIRQQAEVNALNTVEEVEVYDVTKGYPEMLAFNI